MQACVNSTGASGTNACATLFTNTTPASTYAASPVVPTNTLQAMVNLAKYPFMATASIYGIAQSSGFYQPTLTAAPPDFSIAILWRSYAASANQMGSVYYTTLDINDNVYATALTVTTPNLGSIAGQAPFIVNALSSNGTGIWAAPATISTSTSNVCSAYGGTALLDPPCEAATDALGNLWVANGQADAAQSGVYTSGNLAQVNTANGVVTQFTVPSPTTDFPLAVAVDKSNDLFFSTSNNSGNNLWKLPQGSIATTAPTAVTFAGTAYASSHTLGSLAFDTSGNIFASHNAGGGLDFSYGPNTATFPAETFGTLSDCNYCSADGLNEGINNEPSSSFVDASGNFWFEGKYGLFEMSAASAASQTGAVNVGLGNSGTTVLRQASMDGAGTIFVPDASAGATGSANPLGPPTEPSPVLRIFYPSFSSATTLSIAGCNTGSATGNTTCATANAGGANN